MSSCNAQLRTICVCLCSCRCSVCASFAHIVVYTHAWTFSPKLLIARDYNMSSHGYFSVTFAKSLLSRLDLAWTRASVILFSPLSRKKPWKVSLRPQEGRSCLFRSSLQVSDGCDASVIMAVLSDASDQCLRQTRSCTEIALDLHTGHCLG